MRETAEAIRGQAIEERDRMYSGMANTVGELVRNMQDAHKQGFSELLNNLNRGLPPTINNLFQSDNRHVTLQDQRQVHMHDGRQVHMHDQRSIHNPSSSSTDANPPMAAIAPPQEEVVPSKLKTSRKKAPKSEAGQAQARLVAGLIDGFQQARAAYRAQQQNDRRLSIEDQSAATRGRALTRAQSSRDDTSPKQPEKSVQLPLTDKRGRSSSRTPAQGRDETPDFPLEGTVLVSDIANKKAKHPPKKSCENVTSRIVATSDQTRK